jgi:amino acid transporter
VLLVAFGMLGAVLASNMMFQKELYYPINGWHLWLEYPLALTIFIISIVLIVLNFIFLHMFEKREFDRLSDESKQRVRLLESRLRIPALILAFLLFLNQFFAEGIGKVTIQVATVIMILIMLYFEFRRRKFIKSAV